jgi:hypothetical protein
MMESTQHSFSGVIIFIFSVAIQISSIRNNEFTVLLTDDIDFDIDEEDSKPRRKSIASVNSSVEEQEIYHDQDNYDEYTPSNDGTPRRLKRNQSSISMRSDFSIGLNRSLSFGKHLSELGEFCSSGQIALKIIRFTIGCLIGGYGLYMGSLLLRNRSKVR